MNSIQVRANWTPVPREIASGALNCLCSSTRKQSTLSLVIPYASGSEDRPTGKPPALMTMKSDNWNNLVTAEQEIPPKQPPSRQVSALGDTGENERFPDGNGHPHRENPISTLELATCACVWDVKWQRCPCPP